ncbi:MAG: hypothetical protein PHI86_07370 [Candidatus Omnitrophica bacterium]|nr:hypothetical protein [Candidatus Omnitrophota bacterium]
MLDTNSIIKLYVDMRGSEVVRHLYQNPAVLINIANTQVVEVISLFYKFRREGVFSSDEERTKYVDTFLKDISDKKIEVYDFADEHIKDFEVYEKITNIEPPFKNPIRPKQVFIHKWNAFFKEVKEPADGIDTIMLLIMREMHLMTQKEAFIFSSDGHVKKVAEALGLKIIDPESKSLRELPEELLRFRNKRENINLRAICIDCESSLQLNTSRAVNICKGGLCLETRNLLTVGKRLDIRRLESYDGSKTIENIPSTIVWYDQQKQQAGLKFLNDFDHSVFLS